MRWAVAFHPDQVKTLSDGRQRLMVAPLQIAESSVAVAKEQGWIVLGMDSDVLTEPIPARVDVPAQSNPRRHVEPPALSNGDEA